MIPTRTFTRSVGMQRFECTWPVGAIPADPWNPTEEEQAVADDVWRGPPELSFVGARLTHDQVRRIEAIMSETPVIAGRPTLAFAGRRLVHDQVDRIKTIMSESTVALPERPSRNRHGERMCSHELTGDTCYTPEWCGKEKRRIQLMAAAQFPAPPWRASFRPPEPGKLARAPNDPDRIALKPEGRADREARGAQIEEWLDAHHDRVMLRR